MLSKWNRKRKLIVSAAVCVLLAGGGFGVYQSVTAEPEKEASGVTKETTVCRGNLTAGITESGDVEIDALTQSFSLDWSDSTSASAGSLGESSQSSQSSQSDEKKVSAGQSEGGQTAKTDAGSSQSGSSDAELIVEKVYAAAGQKVTKGDKLLQLTSDSVEEVREVYRSALEAAEDAYEEARLTQESERVSAKYTYQQSIAKGESASLAYQASLASLSAQVSSARNAYKEAKKGIASLPAQIQKLQKQIKAKKGGAASDSGSPESAQTMTTDSKSSSATDSGTVSALQQELLQKQEKLKQYKQNLQSLKAAYHAAVKAQTTGKIEARAAYKESRTAAKNAKVTYQAALSSLKAEIREAKTAYEAAKKGKKEFETFVKGNAVCAEYSGTISEIGYAAGDSLRSATAIASYLDQEGVSVTVSVSQEDISQIQIGNAAVVTLSAYDGKEFEGEVTSISTVSGTDSTASYAVEVTIQPDDCEVYSGMNSEVIFVSKQVKDVLYVSKKAITTEGNTSYAVLKKEDGSLQKTKVTTGFSDGHNIEIQSGLEEGDTVLIESRVSQ